MAKKNIRECLDSHKTCGWITPRTIFHGNNLHFYKQLSASFHRVVQFNFLFRRFRAFRRSFAFAFVSVQFCNTCKLQCYIIHLLMSIYRLSFSSCSRCFLSSATLAAIFGSCLALIFPRDWVNPHVGIRSGFNDFTRVPSSCRRFIVVTCCHCHWQCMNEANYKGFLMRNHGDLSKLWFQDSIGLKDELRNSSHFHRRNPIAQMLRAMPNIRCVTRSENETSFRKQSNK